MSTILFYIFYAVVWLITLLPLGVLYLFADLIFILLYGVFRYRRNVVKDNLAKALPERSEQERRIIARRFYRYLCSFMMETIKQLNMSKRQMLKRITVKNDYLAKKAKEGKNIVVMIGHNANWEWLPALSAYDDYHWIAPYHPLQNKRIDAIIKKLRSSATLEPVPMKYTYRRLLEINKTGQMVAAAMVADQSPPNPKNKHWITFLNQDTAVLEGPERIAQRSDAVVAFCKMTRTKRGYYDVEFIPITEDIHNEEDLFVTKRYYELLEELIKEQPECWLWSHRRWKRKRPTNKKLIKE